VGGQTNTSFSLIRAGSGSGKAGTLVLPLLDLRCLDEEVISAAALRERKSTFEICCRMLARRWNTAITRSDEARSSMGRGCESSLATALYSSVGHAGASGTSRRNGLGRHGTRWHARYRAHAQRAGGDNRHGELHVRRPFRLAHLLPLCHPVDTPAAGDFTNPQ
jgi:hypothetical protein